MKVILFVLAAATLAAASPALTELQPRGAQKGRPFTLTLVGQNFGEGGRIVSSLPATFTPLGNDRPMMGGRYASFLVEPTSDWLVGVYPIRLQSSAGLSNILLFSVGAFPEISEEESQPGALPNSNDSIERAQSLPTSPITLNGTLRGPEKDVYRLQVKAGERRVFEVDARRAGSSIDPVISVLDGSGKLIARSEDVALIGLDARLDVTFPAAGFYYVEVHDARYSTQAQNFYRLKTGAFSYVADIFPLGGRRGAEVEVNLSGTKVKANLKTGTAPQTFVNLPDSPSLPVALAIGDFAELTEPVTSALTLPVTINGRLEKPLEMDRYELAVKPGDDYFFELQARELGTSKLMGVISVLDAQGRKLASAGDGPLAVDLFAVQGTSRTAGDPYLNFQVPAGVDRITVTVEDLAQRGGPNYGYRLMAQKAAYDVQATITTPFVNLPAGGTAIVNFNVDRRGYLGPLRIKPVQLPQGVEVSGGVIPAEVVDTANLNRLSSRRAMLSLSATDAARLTGEPISFVAVGDGFERPARGVGYLIAVAGATDQGVVDRQRALNGRWLGYELPAALTTALPAGLELKLEKSDKKESGYEFLFRWKWHTKDPMQSVPATVSVDVPNFTDLRVIGMEVDKKDSKTGTFLVTSTRNTTPALYDIGITGRIMVDGAPQDVVSKIHSFTLPAIDPEEKPANANPTTAR